MGSNLAEKSISIDNLQVTSYAALGQIYILKKDWDKGIALLYKAIELEPNGAESNFSLGLGLNFAGKPGEGLLMLEKRIQLYPNYLFAHLNLSACYILAGREREAYAEAKEVLRLNTKISVDKLEKALQLRNQEGKKRFIGALWRPLTSIH